MKCKISEIILKGPEDKLKLTENTQPAILTVSYSIFKIMQDEFELNLDLLKSCLFQITFALIYLQKHHSFSALE